MRTLVHLSDIHFGKVDRDLIEPLIRAVHAARPSLVVVSGDLTQLARRREFRAARDFLHSLPGPQIVVPGNHDLPIWNPIERFTRPLARFKRYITPNLYPFYEDDAMAVMGLNTARSRRIKYGHINRAQLALVREKFCAIPNDRLKILVTHHPFELPEDYRDTRQLINRAGRAMSVLSECGVDMLLAGHLHRVFTSDTAERYKIENYAALIIQAGTATSLRSSPEQNSFNIIGCQDKSISVARMVWDAPTRSFTQSAMDRFEHSSNGWSRSVALATPIPPPAPQ